MIEQSFWIFRVDDVDLESDLPSVEEMKVQRKIKGYDIDDAVTKWASRYQSEQVFYPEEMFVFMMDEQESVYKMVVKMEAQPHYWVEDLEVIIPAKSEE